MAALESVPSSDAEPRQTLPRSPRGRRSFTEAQRKAAWERAKPVPGRDPERWRYDVYGNPVLRPLHGCLGCFCYEFDHRVPYSLGGATSLDNCDILQTRINRLKSNALEGVNISREQIRQYACEDVSNVIDMDAIEFAVYGDVRREGLHCRAYSLFEKVASEMLVSTGRVSRFESGSPAVTEHSPMKISRQSNIPSCTEALNRTPQQQGMKPVPSHPEIPIPPAWLFLPSFS
jgi:hypothetical protein